MIAALLLLCIVLFYLFLFRLKETLLSSIYCELMHIYYIFTVFICSAFLLRVS